MNKKYITMILLCCIFTSKVVFAQDSGSKLINIALDGNTFNQANEEVQTIDIKFCDNDAKTKQYTFFAGQAQDICLQITSTAGKDILLSMDFVDGTVTNDQRKNKTCLDNNQTKEFGQYVTGIEQSFIVPTQGTLVKHATLKYPETSKGSFHGCLVYYTKEANSGGITDFNILVRKAKFIDVEVKEPVFKKYLSLSIVGIGILLILLITRYSIRRKKV